MRIVHCVQGESDWFQEHLGRVTASRASAVMDFTQKGVEGSTRRLYRLEKVAELLSQIGGAPNYLSAPMLAGTAAEPLARTAYELEEGVMVQCVGIVIGDDERVGWSPDGIITADDGSVIGAIEVKGPKTTTHLQTLDGMKIPEGNLPQLHFAFMVCPTLQWIDFISRDGGMCEDKHVIAEAKAAGNDLRILPLRYAQVTIRLNRSECEAQIAKMRLDADKFLADVDATVERIKSICPELPAPEKKLPSALEGFLSDEDFEGLT